MNTPDYTILYDSGKPICFVGDTYANHFIYSTYKDLRSCELVRYEDLADKPQEWFDARQFFCTSSTLPFKEQMVATLDQHSVQYVSFIENSVKVGNNVSIGHNTCILGYTTLFDDVKIGNHCHLVAYITLAHDSELKDFCYICPYAYICFTTLERGVVVGLRSSFVPLPNNRLTVPSYTNFLMNSVINKAIPESGTYFGNRKMTAETSLTYKIF